MPRITLERFREGRLLDRRGAGRSGCNEAARMIRIDCPRCGPRDEIEFTYRGDATVRRPEADAPAEALHDYVYARKNPRGWHKEWWHHAHGCRQYLQVVRHTLTHEVRSVARGRTVELPVE